MSQPQDGGAAAAGSLAADWLAVVRCDPGSGEAFWGLHSACQGRLQQEPGARAAAAEGETVTKYHMMQSQTVQLVIVARSAVPDTTSQKGQHSPLHDQRLIATKGQHPQQHERMLRPVAYRCSAVS